MESESLSDKILEFKTGDGLIKDKIISAKNVRKAVKKLKEEFNDCDTESDYAGSEIKGVIDKIFGEKLI